jgi:hypothetical protein
VVRNRLTLLAILIVSVPALATETLDFEIGKSLFNRNWVSAPASTKADDGLGPLSDASSCAACHAGERRDEIMVIRLGNAEGNGDQCREQIFRRNGTDIRHGISPQASPMTTVILHGPPPQVGIMRLRAVKRVGIR